MSIKEIFILGGRAVFYNKKFISLFWGANAAAALILSLPLYYILSDNLSHSLMSQKLLSSFDNTWFIQFKLLYSKNIGQLPYLIYGMVGIYLLVQNFFLGGLITIYNSPKKNHMVDFFFGGVKYWLRFTRLLVIFLILFFILFLLYDWTGHFSYLQFRDNGNEMVDFIFQIIKYFVLVFIIGLFTLISDYTKVSLVVNDKLKVIRELKEITKFVIRNFNKLFAVFFIVAVLGAFGVIVYNILQFFVPTSPYYYLILVFFLQQILIIYRLFIKMLFYSTDLILFKDLSAAVINLKSEKTKEV